jgi:hypothetical protein
MVACATAVQAIRRKAGNIFFMGTQYRFFPKLPIARKPPNPRGGDAGFNESATDV